MFLILREEGILKDINPAVLEEIERLQSFIFIEIFLKRGQKVRRTVDCYTFGGVMRLVHENEEQLIADYERIRTLECGGLFVFEPSQV